MSSNLAAAIDVRDLSKEYSIQEVRPKWWGGGGSFSQFRALKEISFSVAPGEVVGVVGRNGAGKSTLLKILTRITPPTRGAADICGRVGSLLEVGTGFHPELTGRENIFFNGAILGMRRSEIRSEFNAIVAFAGVESFLDTPVKRYSSGMYVRLAFAVAAHLRSEILLIDEVLAVGDVEFQKRCLGKMRDVACSGRTVLFVSHHLQSVAALCSRLLVLEGGELVHDGPVQTGIERYMSSLSRTGKRSLACEKRAGSGELRVVSAQFDKDFFECAEVKVLRFRVAKRGPFFGRFFASVHLVDSMGTVLVQCDSRLLDGWFEAENDLDLEFRLTTPWLKPGTYHADIFLCASGVLDQCEYAAALEVLPLAPYPATTDSEATANGVVFADFQFRRAASSCGIGELTAVRTVGPEVSAVAKIDSGAP